MCGRVTSRDFFKNAMATVTKQYAKEDFKKQSRDYAKGTKRGMYVKSKVKEIIARLLIIKLGKKSKKIKLKY